MYMVLTGLLVLKDRRENLVLFSLHTQDRQDPRGVRASQGRMVQSGLHLRVDKDFTDLLDPQETRVVQGMGAQDQLDLQDPQGLLEIQGRMGTSDYLARREI